MIKLYDMPGNSNSRKIHALARELDINVETIAVDLQKGEGQKAEFLAINPNGKIPAMTDGELKLFESNAILLYVAAKYNSPLLPKEAEGRAVVDQWLFWQTAHLSTAMGKVAWERVYKTMLNMGTPDEARIQEGLTELNRFLGILDGVLSQQTFVCGNKMTVADYALCAVLAKAPRERMGVTAEVQKHKNVSRWLGEIESRPAWVHAEK